MKTKIMKLTEINITHVRINIPVRYEEEDIPNDFPLRKGDIWKATVEIDIGKILEWPIGKTGNMYMKVCDEGIYTLLDGDKEIGKIDQDYVPNDLIPGEYGDYIELKINANGIIENWTKKPEVGEFFNKKGTDE